MKNNTVTTNNNDSCNTERKRIEAIAAVEVKNKERELFIKEQIKRNNYNFEIPNYLKPSINSIVLSKTRSKTKSITNRKSSHKFHASSPIHSSTKIPHDKQSKISRNLTPNNNLKNIESFSNLALKSDQISKNKSTSKIKTTKDLIIKSKLILDKINNKKLILSPPNHLKKYSIEENCPMSAILSTKSYCYNRKNISKSNEKKDFNSNTSIGQVILNSSTNLINDPIQIYNYNTQSSTKGKQLNKQASNKITSINIITGNKLKNLENNKKKISISNNYNRTNLNNQTDHNMYMTNSLKLYTESSQMNGFILKKEQGKEMKNLFSLVHRNQSKKKSASPGFSKPRSVSKDTKQLNINSKISKLETIIQSKDFEITKLKNELSFYKHKNRSQENFDSSHTSAFVLNDNKQLLYQVKDTRLQSPKERDSQLDSKAIEKKMGKKKKSITKASYQQSTQSTFYITKLNDTTTTSKNDIKKELNNIKLRTQRLINIAAGLEQANENSSSLIGFASK